MLRPFEEINLDLGKIKNAADVYTSSTGLECFAIDSLGNYIYSTKSDSLKCAFCKKAQKLLGNEESCRNVHLYGCYQAERFGGKYIFFCPLGMVHWASPIVINGIIKGAFLGGPVMMVEPEDFLFDEILVKHNVTDEELMLLKGIIKTVPVIKPTVVNSLSELLFMVANNVSDRLPSQYEEEQKQHELQSDISEYIHFIKSMGGNDESLHSYPLEKEKELLARISRGDKAGSQKILNEILGYIFFSTGNSFELIKARVLELIVLLSRAALEGGADVELIFGLNYKYLYEIHNFRTIEELTYWLSGIMTRFTDCVFNLTNVKHVDVIYKAIDFIKRNYMKKIILDDVANHVYLSPSYFSKIFKEEMNCNFTTYLNQIRIDVSKKLLLDDSIALVEISNLVGYEDQSYYSKVFKKITGVSPGKYRESRGKLTQIT